MAYITDARLVVMDFGCWEGQRWDAIPQADYDRWMAAFGAHRFGGRESVHEFMRRVVSAWNDAQHLGLDAVWITHAGVIRAASLLAQGVRQVEQAAQWPQEAPAFGGWCELGVVSENENESTPSRLQRPEHSDRVRFTPSADR